MYLVFVSFSFASKPLSAWFEQLKRHNSAVSKGVSIASVGLCMFCFSRCSNALKIEHQKEAASTFTRVILLRALRFKQRNAINPEEANELDQVVTSIQATSSYFFWCPVSIGVSIAPVVVFVLLKLFYKFKRAVTLSTNKEDFFDLYKAFFLVKLFCLA